MARIFVIDDDPIVTDIIRRALVRSDHQVEIINDSSLALPTLIEKDFDVVILDVQMPDKSGFEVLRELRSESRTAKVPVLMLSGLGGGSDRVKGLREGADDYLAKPFEIEELRLRIERLAALRPPTVIRDAIQQLKERLQNNQSLHGIVLGRYEVRSLIGKGAMGIVLEAWDPKLQRRIAIKTVRLDVYHRKFSTEWVGNLLHEAMSAAQLNSPHVVGVHDVYDDPDIAFLAMEYVDGVTLESYLEAHGPFSPPLVVSLGLAIAGGLAAAHSRDLVHSDVKCANILLGSDNTIKVSDFGVAKFLSKVNPSVGHLYGTPGYLSPEALLEQGNDQRCDLFGLGAILYTCLTGDQPFVGKTFLEVIQATLHQEPARLDQLAGMTPALEELILNLLAKDREARPQTADEVCRWLRGIQEQDPVSWKVDSTILHQAWENEKPSRERSQIIKTVSVGDPLDS